MTNWITLTVAPSGYRKRVRASAVVSYGTLPSGATFVDLAGRTVEVFETEAQVAALVGDKLVN
jgi:hypothetical protein